MCLHYLAKLIARVLSLYITYFTPDFIPPSLWPPNSPDLNPVDYAIWGIVQERVYNKERLQMLNFASASWTSGNVLISALSTAQWRSGENDCERVLLLKEDSLKMNCDSWCNSVVATVHSDFAVYRLTAYKICRDCFQCSLTLSVTCSRCEAL